MVKYTTAQLNVIYTVFCEAYIPVRTYSCFKYPVFAHLKCTSILGIAYLISLDSYIIDGIRIGIHF